jgi:hypothetical protein
MLIWDVTAVGADSYLFANTRGLFYHQTEDDLMYNDSKIFINLVAPTLVMESELITIRLGQIRFVM